VATSATAVKQPWFAYLGLIALGVAPLALVTRYYGVLPNRLVVQWDTFGNTTVIGTRPASVLMIANIAAVVALVAIAVAIWQNRALVSIGARRAFLALNFAQIVAIGLTCAMIVSDAMGLQLAIRPAIPPVMAVLLFAGAVLCYRASPPGTGLGRIGAYALGVAAFGLLALSAIAANAVVGYYASAFALLAMAALALPENAR
jgi:uncharacterized membrane protein